MALAEKSSSFTVRQIGTLSDLMDGHSRTTPVTSQAISIESGKIEEATWELNMNQMKYDLQAFLVFKAKMEHFFSAVKHIKLDWKMKAYEENSKAVEKFVMKIMRLTSFEEKEQATRDLTTFKLELEKNMQATSENMVFRD
jgi:tRNA nucleotidyltransferase/poly(A) polymerase